MNETIRYNPVLCHYGIVGMKWGVRRYQNKDGTLTSAGKKRKEQSPDNKRIEQRKKDLKNKRVLSTAEIEKRVARLELERKFQDLSEKDIAPGRAYVMDILTSAGKKALTGMAAGAAVYAVKVAMTKEFNLADAAQYIAANPNKKK